ncbi:MAG: MMPL family transporter [Candidatus Thermoplasmatota archaeon]|nr:MMPL family transporter [Candidatus Thermoplasmatota archaeon]
MKNFFDNLTGISVNRPKASLGLILVLILAIVPNAMFIKFDNSEDAFFPDNETVRLLNEVEDEYQASIDFIRFIDHIEPGDLKSNETWTQLAKLEAILLEDENLGEYQYPISGIQANSGMASAAISWQMMQDPVLALTWITPLQNSISLVSNSNNSTISESLEQLELASLQIPEPSLVTSQMLRNWDAGNPSEWLERIDAGQNISANLFSIGSQIENLLELSNNSNLTVIVGQISAKLGALIGMQSLDYRSQLIASLPADDKTNPWESDGPVLTTIAVVTEPSEHDVEVIGDVQDKITIWADELKEKALKETGDEDISVFSFSQFATGQNDNLGKELGILNSICLLLLGFILWTKFRSLRDTASVLVLTVFAIIATYGMAGILTFLGVKMVFNAAMNSIPILLLAIGVDYGLHVVARIREELQDQEKSEPKGRKTLRDFSVDARRNAIRKGTILTSAALLVAIFTDMVGFLSFRFSSQQFLVSFGTVIAIGLFFIYLLSITALPALLMMIPPKRLPLEKSGRNDIGPVSTRIGSLSAKPAIVLIATTIISIPMFMGFQALEVGFDTRDNFDDSVPVVQDYLMIADEFQNSPSPLYAVIEGDVISMEGKRIYDGVLLELVNNSKVRDVPTGIWDVLESSKNSNSELNDLLANLDSNPESYAELKAWLLTSDGRNVSSGKLNSDASQTLISFQAATLDWQATANFESQLSNDLRVIGEQSDEDFSVMVSGRSLILAQVTADVADSAVTSTATVAGVILVMLIAINSFRQRDIVAGSARGFVTWVPLMVVVIWVYGIMGLTGYQLNSQTVTIGALTLGLGVDYAVHITTRLEEEVEHAPTAEPVEWTTKSVATTGRAMFGAALTTAGGFSVLNFSSLVPLQLFGQVFVVAIILALVSSIFVLPALYTPFLKMDARKILSEKNSISESE